MAAYNYASLGVFALMPALREAFDLTTGQIGLFASTQFVIAAAGAVAAARVTDRYDARVVVAVSQLATIAALCTLVVAKSQPTLWASAALLGVGSALINPVTNVLSAKAISARRRGLAMSVKQTGVTMGGILAGGTLPAVAAVASWRAAVLLPAAAAACVTIAAVRGRERERGSVHVPLVLSDAGSAVPRRCIAVFGFAMSGIQFSLFAYLTVYLVDRHTASPEQAGAVLATALVAGGVGRIAWGALSDRVAARPRILHVVAAGAALLLAAVPVVPKVAVWPAFFSVGLFAVGWNGAYHAVVAESAGQGGVARATAFVFLFLYAGAIVVPALLGHAVDVLSWSLFWWGASGFAGLAALAMSSRALRAWRDPSPLALETPGRAGAGGHPPESGT